MALSLWRDHYLATTDNRIHLQQALIEAAELARRFLSVNHTLFAQGVYERIQASQPRSKLSIATVRKARTSLDPAEATFAIIVQNAAEYLDAEMGPLTGQVVDRSGKTIRPIRHLEKIWKERDYANTFRAEYPDTASKAHWAAQLRSYTKNLPLLFEEIDDDVNSRIRDEFFKKGDQHRPLAFYHWPQKHDDLHLVDFIFLRVLEDFKNQCGFQPHVLVSGQPLSSKVTTIILKMLGRDAITTRQQALNSEDNYMDFARDCAEDFNGLEERLEDVINRPATPFIAWIPYYVVKIAGRCGYVQLYWQPTGTPWGLAYSFRDVKRVGLKTKSIRLGGLLAKEVSPPLLMEGMPFKSIANWLFSPATPAENEKRVQELFRYLSPIEGAHNQSMSLQNMTLAFDWEKKISSQTSKETVQKLASILEQWDHRYF